MQGIYRYIRAGWNSFWQLFFPARCLHCGALLADTDEVLCAECLARIPRSYSYLERGNRVEARFHGKAAIERGAAFCTYVDDVREMIHQFKYRGRADIGIRLAEQAAQEWKQNSAFFCGIDLLVPVPLHPKRLRQRGYNQSELICRGLQRATGIPTDTAHLVRRVNNPSQTTLQSEQQRMQNTRNIFAVRQPADWQGKHILLVDDIITTGATLSSCVREINRIPHTTVSVFSLALAGL